MKKGEAFRIYYIERILPEIEKNNDRIKSRELLFKLEDAFSKGWDAHKEQNESKGS